MPKRPQGFSHGAAPESAPYLIVRLKPSWRADFDANTLVSGRKRVVLGELTKAKVSLQPHIPSLAGKSLRSLSAAERELARFVQVRVPAGQDASELAKELARLDAVEHVSVAPEVSLPKSKA